MQSATRGDTDAHRIRSIRCNLRRFDVSKDHIDTCSFDAAGGRRTRRFSNTPAGYRRRIGWLDTDEPVRVVVESTGRYSLDLTLALHTSQAAEVMVANSKALRGFANAQMPSG